MMFYIVYVGIEQLEHGCPMFISVDRSGFFLGVYHMIYIKFIFSNRHYQMCKQYKRLPG